MRRMNVLLIVSMALSVSLIFCLSGCHSHTAEIDAAVPATCFSEGKTEGSHCSECGEVITEQTEIPMIEHAPVTDEAVDSTCSVEGETEGSHCSVCDAVIVAQESVAKLAHTSVTDEAVESTCSVEGKTEGSHCSVCGEILIAQESVEKLPHPVAVEPAIDASCVAEGSTERIYCTVCNEVIKEKTILPKTEHTVVTDPAVDATCSSVGYTEGSHCSVCNEIFKAQETVEKLPHTKIQIPQVDSTCSTKGVSAITKCSVCDEFIAGGLSLPLEPHTPVEIPGKAATCTTVGLSRGYSCSVCNTLVTAQKETPKIPHSFNGNKCTVCGYVRNVNSSDTAETGLTLKGLINKDISILKYFNLYTGSSVHLGFKDTSISGAKIYVTESDVLGYPCTIYLFTSPDSSLIYSIHCYAKMSTYNRANLLSAETATKYTNETMKALNTIFNTINNNFNATVESVEDIHGIFAPTPTVNKLQYSDIYDKIYKRYPTGFVCESGIIQIKGKLSAGKYSNCEYRVYIAEYSTDGGWYIHGNCIVVEF